MKFQTHGNDLKQNIDNEETHLEYLMIKYGVNSAEYQAAAQKLEARRKYLENMEGHTPKEVRRG